LKKGKAFHVDLFVIAILNGCLSLFGLTWMHGSICEFIRLRLNLLLCLF